MSNRTMISVTQAARQLKCSPAWVRKLIADERLPARRVRDSRNLPVWEIDPADLDAARQTIRRYTRAAPRDEV